MKKIIYSLIFVLISFFIVDNVNASSFSASITGDATFKNEITLNVVVNNIEGFTGSCNGLCGLTGKLNYDNTKIELVSISPLNEFDLIQGNKLVLYRPTGVANGTKILIMKFKNKSLTDNETTTISLKEIVASDGIEDINGSDISKTIKFVVPQITNNEPVAKSSNNNLKDLTLSSGSIEFKNDVVIYHLIVSNDITEISVNANTEHNKATIVGIGTHKLKVGTNVIEIVVKAENGNEKTYTINIVREEKNIVEDTDNNDINNNINDDNNENIDSKKESPNSVLIIIITVLSLLVVILLSIIIKMKKNR